MDTEAITEATERRTRHCTDLGNAERLVDTARGRLHWVHGLGWLWWDGKRWMPDTAMNVQRTAKQAAISIYKEALEAEDSKDRAALSKHARTSESASKIDAMIRLAASEPRVILDGVDRLDSYPNALNVQNGIFSMKDGTLVPHDPGALLTKIANAGYDESAECPFWQETLNYFLPDNELQLWVQKAAGYSMLGTYSEFLFIPYGKGANGKSTFLWALRDVLGDYAIEAAPELLTERKERNAGTDSALANLRGARLVTTIETEQGKKMAESLMKQLTGESTLKAKYMRQDYFEFENQAAVWLATNHKPVVQGTDFAVWRRVRLIPFEVTATSDMALDQDEVKKKLRAERNGILRWLVEGLLMYRLDGSMDPTPAAVMAATDQYREEMDALSSWRDDCCVFEIDALTPTTVLRESYEDHCRGEGRHPVAATRFKQELEELGLEYVNQRIDGRKTRCWRGVKVESETQRLLSGTAGT